MGIGFEEDLDDYNVFECCHGALAVSKLHPMYHLTCCDKWGLVAVLTGNLINAAYLNMKHCDGNCQSDAEIVLELFSKMRFTCLSKLKGRFNLIIMNKYDGTAFAATDAFHTYELYQGVDFTGGLFI